MMASVHLVPMRWGAASCFLCLFSSEIDPAALVKLYVGFLARSVPSVSQGSSHCLCICNVFYTLAEKAWLMCAQYCAYLACTNVLQKRLLWVQWELSGALSKR